MQGTLTESGASGVGFYHQNDCSGALSNKTGRNVDIEDNQLPNPLASISWKALESSVLHWNNCVIHKR